MDTLVTILLFGFLGLSTLVGIAAVLVVRSPHQQIGQGGFAPPADPVAETADLREQDVRQMLQAQQRRRIARGEPAGDVERQLRELLASGDDGSAVASGGAGGAASHGVSTGGDGGAGGAARGGSPTEGVPAGAVAGRGPEPGAEHPTDRSAPTDRADDAEIVAEAHALVAARNARHRRRGTPEEDVETAVAAILRELGHRPKP